MITSYPHINQLLDRLLAALQTILADKLVGLYLYGSLVTVDFDNGLSDIDLMVALSHDLTPTEFAALDNLHNAIVAQDHQWDNRIEIAYISLNALATFRTKTSLIGIISPGEPFHFKEAGNDWLMNWYMIREVGKTLYGLSPTQIIAPISKAEFIDAVRRQIRAWGEWIEHVESRPYQAYVILTLCRGLYTLTHREQVSKHKAALWAIKSMPAWSTLIQDALALRLTPNDPHVDNSVTLPETHRFVTFVMGQVNVDEAS